MPEHLQTIADFWDDFAEDYEMIQNESTFPIQQDLTNFLLSEKIIPCHTFLDLAGGSGRYLSALQNYVEKYTLVDISKKMLDYAKKKALKNVQFINCSQEELIKSVNPRFEIVFSAMNPAIQTKNDLLDVFELSQKWCLLLRVILDEDQLFSPYEESNPDLLLNDQYKRFLQEENIPFKTKKFTYSKTEKINKDFFHEYFEEDFSRVELEKMVKHIFDDQPQRSNQQFLTFELIYFHVPKDYNKNRKARS